MAIVYLARDPNINRQVALKVLPREMTYDPQFRVRFQREAETIARLEHPSIVPIYDFGTEGEQPFIVMRYMTGGSLGDQVEQQKKFSLDEIARIFSQIAPALDEAHQQGIVHRDLKPDNILFDQRRRAMITDFGIVKLTEASFALTGDTILGTPAYMSPEQVHGTEALDGRSDIYSLGVILFQLLTGSLPYQSDQPMALALMHVQQPIPRLAAFAEQIPPKYQDLIDRALAKDRNDRFASAVEFSQNLSNLSVQEAPPAPVKPPPAPATPEAAPQAQLDPAPYRAPVTRTLQMPEAPQETTPPKKPARPRWVWLGLIGLVVLAAALSAVFLLPRDQPAASQEAGGQPTATTAVLAAAPTTETDETMAAPTTEIQPALTPTLIPAPDFKDLDTRPQIWFGPLDPWSWDQYYPDRGPFQFYDLFMEGAPWPQVSEAVQVIRLYPVWLESYATDAQLAAVLGDIQRRGMAISYEAGPLTETETCNAATVEGFWGRPAAQSIVDNIARAGGYLYSMDLQHAFDAGTFSDANCRMPPHEIAADAANTIEAVWDVFPDARIGSIETADLDPDAVADWLAAYREVMGRELDYFHLDPNYLRRDWPERALAIEEVVKARGIEFGIIYFGDHLAGSDRVWLEQTEQHFTTYEVFHGGSPDHVVFQSWHRYPQVLFPEADPNTFTNLVLKYLRPRSELALETTEGTLVRGTLQEPGGGPIAAAPVELRAVPVSGSGLLQEYVITGEVPAFAEFADAGYRVNHECDGCSGPAEFILERVEYVEAGSGTSWPMDGDFSQGTNFWGLWGNAEYRIVSSPYGNGRALSVSALPGEEAGANSSGFDVTPGSTFTVTFTARVNPITNNSGYFDIIFQNNSGEGSRSTINIQAGEIVLGEAVTDANGGFEFDLGAIVDAEVILRFWFPGDESWWPAFFERRLEFPGQ